MKSKFFRAAAMLLSVIMICSSFFACTQPVNVDEGGVSAVTQDYPVVVNEITINAKPSKVVALSGNIADIILAMGYETSLAAVSDDSTQTDYESLQKFSVDDVDGICGITPDLILSDSFTDAQRSAFDAAGIQYIEISRATNREDFERMYSQIGSCLDGAGTGYTKGIETAQSIFTTLDDLSRIIPETDTVITGCYLYDTESSAVTGDMLMSTLMTYAGITNVFKGTTGGSFELSNLKITNPQYIFCPAGLKTEIMADTDLASLTAVRNGNVFELEPQYGTWEGRTVVLAATEMAGIAYPELTEESTASATASTVEESESSETSAESGSSEASESSESGAESSEVSYSELSPEDDSDEVLAMQQRLEELGYLTEEYDGYYGEATTAAVTAFQQANGLTESGTANEATLQLLFSDSATAAE